MLDYDRTESMIVNRLGDKGYSQALVDIEGVKGDLNIGAHEFLSLLQIAGDRGIKIYEAVTDTLDSQKVTVVINLLMYIIKEAKLMQISMETAMNILIMNMSEAYKTTGCGPMMMMGFTSDGIDDTIEDLFEKARRSDENE